MPKVNLTIDQGATFSSSVELSDEQGNPVNTAVYTARGQLRKHYQSNTSTSFTTALSNNTITISLTSTQTANIVAGRYVYDVEIIDASNNVIRLLEGIVTVTPEVTK